MQKQEIKDLIKKIRKYEIQIRKALVSHVQGDYHSIFKGSGLEFDDVRAYQYGDDVRAIDWNVSAKGHGTFVKTFKEEKEQTVLFLVDVSASQEIGKPGESKIDVSREICGLLSFSALKENSQVGLICFSDEKEKYVKPGKGNKHGYEILGQLFNLEPKSRKTDLSKAIKFTLNFVKKKSVIIVISDFIDDDYEHHLKGLARKHDLVLIHISDKRESNLPSLGIIPLHDKESGKTLWVNTSSKNFRNKFNSKHSGSRNELETFAMKNQADYLFVRTDQDYVSQLIRLFKVRNKYKKRA
ncbi:MAG: DUF58 domain-containing protein [Bacteroidota bacterium]